MNSDTAKSAYPNHSCCNSPCVEAPQPYGLFLLSGAFRNNIYIKFSLHALSIKRKYRTHSALVFLVLTSRLFQINQGSKQTELENTQSRVLA